MKKFLYIIVVGLLVWLPGLIYPAAGTFAQNRQSSTGAAAKFTGKVVDDKGEPLPGVFVYNTANKQIGTETDVDGVWHLILPAGCKTLTFSAVGYKQATVAMSKIGLVMLEMDVESLEGAVATGIYTRKAESFTGAVQTITAADLQKVSNQNVFQALKNLDPALLIIDNLQQGSNPNAIAQMQLRGASTIGMDVGTNMKSNFVDDPNTPLFVLDGFETTAEKIQDLDMNRVESITILKDASAKAIYGSKAANGVIVIETKGLRSEQTLVTYVGSADFELPDLTSYNLCKALEKLDVEMREGYYDDTFADPGYERLAYDLYYQRLQRAKAGESTYWLSKPLRMGLGTKHSVSVEMGTRELKALGTISLGDVQGVMKDSWRKTLSANVNLAYRKNGWTFRNIMEIGSMNSSDSPYGSFSDYTIVNPYNNPYDAEGNLVKSFVGFVYDGQKWFSESNPLYDASLDPKFKSNYIDMSDNLYVEWRPIDALKLVGRVGVDAKRTNSDNYYPKNHSALSDPDKHVGMASDNSGYYERALGESMRLSADASAQFNKSIGGVHDIFATAQWNISQNRYTEITDYAEGFPSSHINQYFFAHNYIDGKPSGYTGLNRNVGFLLTSGYSYKNRYMMDATVKTSASSVFGSDNHWGIFWSAGVAWNIHKEDFMSEVTWLDQLKLRFSAGSSGNEGYSTNQSMPVYQYMSNYYGEWLGAVLMNMENPKLGWEQKNEYNVGVDFRTKWLSLNMDAYIADTRNLVFSRTILPSTGFASGPDNLGQVRNKGIEASASFKVYQRGSSFLNLFARVAFNDNRILKISEALETYNATQKANASALGQVEPVIQYYNGAPLHSIWAVRSLGIDAVSGSEVYLNRNGQMSMVWSANDLVNCGSSDPVYTGNYGVNAEHKGWGINLTMRYYGGGYQYNYTLVSKVENTSIDKNVDRRVFEGRWYKRGEAAPYRNGSHQATKATTRFVQRNNVMSLSSLSLYYDVPVKKLEPLGMSRLRISAYSNDVVTLSSIRLERGTSYPYARTFSLSVTATL